LNRKIGQEIEIFSNGERKKRAGFKIGPPIHDAIVADGFILQNDVVFLQKHKIDIAETFSCQDFQDIELSAAKFRRIWKDGQIEVTFMVHLSGDERAENIYGLNLRETGKDIL